MSEVHGDYIFLVIIILFQVPSPFLENPLQNTILEDLNTPPSNYDC